MVENITMNVDDTLEMDYIVQQISDDTIEVTSDQSTNSYSINYLNKQVGVFDPMETGTYKLEINGQTIEIEVTDIPDSVVSRWRFEDDSETSTAIDSEGTVGGTINGANYDSDSKEGNSSLHFDGVDEYVGLGAQNFSFMDGNGDFSIATWFKLTSLGKNRFFGKWDGDGKLYLGEGGGTGDIPVSDGTVECQMNRASWSSVTSTTTVSTGNWYHVVVTYSSSNGMTLYIDGNEEDSDSSTGALDTDSIGEDIGRDPRGASYINGLLDDVMVANGEWTAQQVQNVYDSY
jgi:hypothetical protein